MVVPLSMGLSVVDIATELKDLKEEYAESWQPEKVLFNLFVEAGNESFMNGLAKVREITGKPNDDRVDDNAKCLRLTEAANQDSDTLSVSWDQFYQAVGRGRSEKLLYITFADGFEESGMLDTRFVVEEITYDEEQNAIELTLQETNAADLWL